MIALLPLIYFLLAVLFSIFSKFIFKTKYQSSGENKKFTFIDYMLHSQSFIPFVGSYNLGTPENTKTKIIEFIFKMIFINVTLVFASLYIDFPNVLKKRQTGAQTGAGSDVVLLTKSA